MRRRRCTWPPHFSSVGYDGGTGCDDWGCDLVGDEAGPCCTPNQQFQTNKACIEVPVDDGPSCSCSCYENGYSCGEGPNVDDERCDQSVCGAGTGPRCYDGGENCDNEGCNEGDDEAGPCCTEDSDFTPQLECGGGGDCDCSCYEAAYACGPGADDARCQEPCGGADVFGGLLCFDGSCDGSGCELDDRAGQCCEPGATFVPQTGCDNDEPVQDSSKKSSKSSSSSILIIIVVVVAGVVACILLAAGVYYGKRNEDQKLAKGATTVEGLAVNDIHGIQLADVQEAKASDSTAGADPVKSA